jgi:hypothetical protein
VCVLQIMKSRYLKESREKSVCVFSNSFSLCEARIFSQPQNSVTSTGIMCMSQ